MTWGRFDVCRGLERERVARVATTVFVIRVAEGLAAWVLFNSFFLSRTAADHWAAAGFVVYFLANLAVVLRIRAGSCNAGVAYFDFLANTVPLVPAVLSSGGLVSPLLLTVPLTASIYLGAFGERMACAFGLLGFAVYGLAVATTYVLPVPARTLTSLPAPQLETLAAAVLVVLTLGVPISVAALRRSLRPASAERAAVATVDRAEPESTPAAVANALLMVSDAISRLTRLDEVLEKVVEVAPRSLAIDYCGIALWDEDTGSYTGAAAAGSGPTIDRRFVGVQVMPDDAPDFEWVRRLGHCAVVPGERHDAAKRDAAALLIAPLLGGNRFFGVIQFARRGSGKGFTQKDFNIADGIARQTAVALDRARLIEESRRLVRALESTGEAVVITDVRRRVIFANPAFMRTFGYRLDEVMGRDALDLAVRDEEWSGDLLRAVSRTGWRGETVLHRKDGSEIPVMLDVSLIRSEDGRTQGAVAIIEDISAEKTRQAEMQRADRLAAVGEMAAGMAHEINNALAAILGQTQRDVEALGEGELRSAVQRIDGQARRIADIVQGVLGFARPRPPKPLPVDLSSVTRSTLDLLLHDIERQGVRLGVTCEPDLPPALADAQQVQQVLLNLLHNALQAMRDTEAPVLRVAVERDHGALAVRVTDCGYGIAPDVMPRIFDPFFSTKAEGTGLGLSVSYAIARAHGGDLSVRSSSETGTTFTLRLPIAGVAPVEGLARILLVDDEPEVADALAAMLAGEGLEVERAATGMEALTRATSEAWDAVFLDVRLPDLSGAEVFERLRETRPEMARRVVFVTGGLWRSEGRLRQQLAGHLVLAKPCTQEQVREVLHLLRRQRQQAA